MSTRNPAAIYQLAKTECPNGHEYTPENTGRNSRGARRCLTCNKARHQRRNESQRLGAPVREYKSPQSQGWRDDAACLGIDPEMFQPDNLEDAKAAIRVCMECPVILNCQVEAKAQGAGAAGVWGGKWHQEKAVR